MVNADVSDSEISKSNASSQRCMESIRSYPDLRIVTRIIQQKGKFPSSLSEPVTVSTKVEKYIECGNRILVIANPSSKTSNS